MDDGSVVGMRVRHAQFGDGEVMACDGSRTEREAHGAVPLRGPEAGHRPVPPAGMKSPVERPGAGRDAGRGVLPGGRRPRPSRRGRRHVYPHRNRRPRTRWSRRRAGRENRNMASNKPVIAVVGATGAQGSGLVRAILQDPERRFTARAITRKPDSDKARALAAQGAEVVGADADDRPEPRPRVHRRHGRVLRHQLLGAPLGGSGGRPGPRHGRRRGPRRRPARGLVHARGHAPPRAALGRPDADPPRSLQGPPLRRQGRGGRGLRRGEGAHHAPPDLVLLGQPHPLRHGPAQGRLGTAGVRPPHG